MSAPSGCAVRVLTGAVAWVRSVRHCRDERLIKRAAKVSLLLRLRDVIRRAAAAFFRDVRSAYDG